MKATKLTKETYVEVTLGGKFIIHMDSVEIEWLVVLAQD